MNVFDIFILALGNWLHRCSPKSWPGISIREPQSLRNNLWSMEKQSHYNQEVLIFRKVQHQKWIASQFPEGFPTISILFQTRPGQERPGSHNRTGGWMLLFWDTDSQVITPSSGVPTLSPCLWEVRGGPPGHCGFLPQAKHLHLLVGELETLNSSRELKQQTNEAGEGNPSRLPSFL